MALGCAWADATFGPPEDSTAPVDTSADSTPDSAPDSATDSATDTAACDVYCTTVMANCVGVYEALADCETACAAFATDGADGDTAGDTLQCRQTAAEAGASYPPACLNAAADGGAACASDVVDTGGGGGPE